MTLELGPKSFDELQATALKLIDLIYEAAMDPAHWNEFLRSYGDLYPGASQWLWLEDRQQADVRILMSEACDRGYLSSYEAHYAKSSPWTKTMFALPEGHVHVGDQLAPREVLEASEFFNDWMRPQDLWDGFGASVLRFGRHFMYFSILHSKGGVTGERDLELLRLLVPHMQRAARLHGHFLSLQDRAAGSEAMLDQLSIGAVLCGAEGRVLFMNQAAEAVTRSRDGLAIERGRLIALAGATNRGLAAMIGDALREPPVASVSEAALLVPRPSGGAPYAVAVAPLPRRARVDKTFIEPGQRAPRLLVTISETDPRPPPAARLRALFALTEAEAALAQAVAAGKKLQEYADEAGITCETARWRLKQVLAKTDTHRQAELVRLLLASAVLAGDGGPGD